MQISSFAAFTVISAALVAITGCSSNVDSGTGQGSGGGGQGGSGAGGGEPCKVGTTRACNEDAGAGEQDCFLDQGTPRWSACQASSVSTTPLVLSFDDAPVAFLASESGDFDLTGLGQSVASDWPSAETPWLALDRDQNGRIDDGSELFGSAVRLSSGRLAENGFEALAELDQNGDRLITEADEAFSKLLVWSDRDASRSSSSAEIASASARRIVSIRLDFDRQRECDARGNCAIERATFRYLDDAGRERSGRIVDVHLRLR
jgi:hypothetical protein